MIVWFPETSKLNWEERWWVPFQASVVGYGDSILKYKCAIGGWKWVDGGSKERFKFETHKSTAEE